MISPFIKSFSSSIQNSRYVAVLLFVVEKVYIICMRLSHIAVFSNTSCMNLPIVKIIARILQPYTLLGEYEDSKKIKRNDFLVVGVVQTR